MPQPATRSLQAFSTPRKLNGKAHAMSDQESNHRIANNLALVSGLIRIRANGLATRGETLTAGEAAGMMREAAARIDNVGRVHRLLTNAAEGDLTVAPYLAEVCAGLSGSVADADCVGFVDRSVGLKMSATRLNTLGLFVAEALTNALKHAHPTGVEGHVVVSLEQSGDDLSVMVQDDGVGLPVGFDPTKDGGLGMRILRSLAKQLNGDLTIEALDFGLCVRLTAPVREASAAVLP